VATTCSKLATTVHVHARKASLENSQMLKKFLVRWAVRPRGQQKGKIKEKSTKVEELQRIEK